MTAIKRCFNSVYAATRYALRVPYLRRCAANGKYLSLIPIFTAIYRRIAGARFQIKLKFDAALTI
jgi:hypothetical protein